MRWVTNLHKPFSKSDAEYLSQVNHVEGEPRATEKVTVDELKEWGYVGIYLLEDADLIGEKS